MNINKMLFPYHRNVPDEKGMLSIKTDYYTREEYIKYLHIDPIIYIKMFGYKIK